VKEGGEGGKLAEKKGGKIREINQRIEIKSTNKTNK